MLGGAFLCYEGFEKLAHKYLHSDTEDSVHRVELMHAVADPTVDLLALEKDKIKGAIRTDFILSAEIIVITLGTVAAASFGQQVAVLTGIAIVMTIGVYGLVAAIVKLDDAGLYLSQRASTAARAVGRMLLAAAPKLMKMLMVIGTAAMFLVGGGILVHGMPAAHHLLEAASHAAAALPAIGGALAVLTPLLIDALAGIAAGALVLGIVSLGKRVSGR
jgi:hypothetical protein